MIDHKSKERERRPSAIKYNYCDDHNNNVNHSNSLIHENNIDYLSNDVKEESKSLSTKNDNTNNQNNMKKVSNFPIIAENHIDPTIGFQSYNNKTLERFPSTIDLTKFENEYNLLGNRFEDD